MLGFCLRSNDPKLFQLVMDIASWLHRSLPNNAFSALINNRGLKPIDLEAFKERDTFEMWTTIKEIQA